MALDIYEYGRVSEDGDYIFTLTKANAEKLQYFANVRNVSPAFREQGQYADYVFPFDPKLGWNEDNFGPLVVPAKGMTMNITSTNLGLYKRVITVYEGNTLEEKAVLFENKLLKLKKYYFLLIIIYFSNISTT